MLYNDASALLKVGGGLSRPISVLRGIRQGCPLSGCCIHWPLNLTCRLKKTLQGVSVEKPIKFVAYADDVTIFLKDERDVSVLKETLKIYEKASTARVNWEKCEGFYCGPKVMKIHQSFQVVLSGVKRGLKCLGVYLGTETFKMKNWKELWRRCVAGCLSGHGCYHSYPIGEEFGHK